MHPFSESWPLSADGPAPDRVAWIQEKPLSFIGAWEPLSFRRRAGYAYTDEAEFMREEEFSDAALKRYIEAGANSIVVPFSKGFGLTAGSGEIEQERDLIARAHRLGMRTGAYIRVDSVVPELARADFPTVDECLSVGMYGRHSRYASQQTFRKRLCYLQPGSVRWLEKLITVAVRDLKADLLHFDGFDISTSPEETCRCARCLGAYRSWLRENYSNNAIKETMFGLVDFDRIEFPEFEPGAPLPPVLSSPDMQAWYRFLWDKQLAFTRHVRRFVSKLSPDVAVSANPWWTRAINGKRLVGQHVETVLPWLDAVWSEDIYHLDFADGRIRSRLGIFKTAREYGIPVCHYHWHADPEKINASLALSLAANGGNPSCLGFSFRYLPHYSLGAEPKRRCANWADENWPLLKQSRPSGEIALIRHHASLAWNASSPWTAAMGLEQLLIQMQVPWRMFDAINAAQLDEVRTVLLPDAECLSDGELATLKGWVERGGRLFFTRKTGTHDENRRRRARHAIWEWLPGVEAPPTAEEWFQRISSDFTEFELKENGAGREPRQMALGAGMLGFWPEVTMPNPICTVHRAIQAKDLCPPANAGGIEDFLCALHGEFDYRLEGPASLMLESSRQAATGDLLLHVVNAAPLGEAVDLTIHSRAEWTDFRVLSSDLHPPRAKPTGKTLHLTGLRRHALVVIQSKTP